MTYKSAAWVAATCFVTVTGLVLIVILALTYGPLGR
jgi:hypothetical protein